MGLIFQCCLGYVVGEAASSNHSSFPTLLFDWPVKEMASFSGPCSVWWPLNNVETFQYENPRIGVEEISVHILCDEGKLYHGSLEVNGQKVLISPFKQQNHYSYNIYNIAADAAEVYNFKILINEIQSNAVDLQVSEFYITTRSRTIEMRSSFDSVAISSPSVTIPSKYAHAQRMMSSRPRTDLGFLLNYLNLNGVGVEVGVLTGEFAEVMLSTWKGELYILVDPWQQADIMSYCNSSDACESIMQKAKSRLSIFGDRAYFLRKFSIDAARIIADNSLDFVYIDGLHDYYNVMLDMMAWWPKVRKGGVMAGHDFNQIPLFHAVTEFARKMNVSFYCTAAYEYPTPSWYMFKL